MLNEKFADAGFRLYLVGGCVRDHLLGIKPKDFDLVTNAKPEEIAGVLKGMNVIPKGEAFGVMAVVIEGEVFEIATFRLEGGYTDGRRPDSIEFTNLEGDYKRRDFTINALYYDLETKEIIDLGTGIEDIRNKVVRCVGVPKDRFNEDKLRVLRYVRFSHRLSNGIGLEYWPLIQFNYSCLQDHGISNERIFTEFKSGWEQAKDKFWFILDLEKTDLLSNTVFKGLDVNFDHLEDVDFTSTIALMLFKGNSVDEIKIGLNKLCWPNSLVNEIVYKCKILKVDNHTSLTDLTRLAYTKPCDISALIPYSETEVIKKINDFVPRQFKAEEVHKIHGNLQGKALGDMIKSLQEIHFLNF